MSIVNKAQMFESEDFIDWKIHMQVYLASVDNDMMYGISKGLIKIYKERSEWKNEDKRKNNLDHISKNSIYNTLDKNTFAKIRACATAKEVWEKIIQLNEGKERTKENKIMVATHKFENVKMRPKKSMNEYCDRFTSIVNDLSLMGKTYDKKETIIKALRALPSAWDVKTMVMSESMSLHKMQLHDIFEDLKAYKFEMNSRNEDEPLISNVTKALLSSVEPAAPNPIKSAEQFSEDAMAMLAKKFKRFMRMSQPSYNNNNDYKAKVRCFNYDGLGHYKSECRKPRRDDKKPTDQNNKEDKKSSNKDQKAMVVEERIDKWAQSDFESSDSDDNEVKCLMANEEEVFDFTFEEFTQDDLIIALNDMVIKYKNLSELVSNQPTKASGSTTELSSKNKKLKEKVQLLTEENERTKYVIATWTRSGDDVSQMTSHQRPLLTASSA
ncbi:uncharacterized protein LOC124939092 [Impatiens glandulifera]|uniref:uncharacterized protein LOC124939092 n=1 Tax=Impatiens glandulifera TaxID=253017 RepID=UPI001FB086E4|nr:uncharacterized protein LOC124939092 [Impatiens glandulifera]